MASSDRSTARIVGWLFIGTFVFSIPAYLLYLPLLDHPDYVVGGGHDTQVAVGAFLEVLTAICNIATAVALYPVLKRYGPGRAAGFVASRTLEAAMIFTGVVAVLSVYTLRHDVAGGADAASLTTAASALVAVAIAVTVSLTVRQHRFAAWLGRSAGTAVGRFRSSVDPAVWEAAATDFRGHVAAGYSRAFRRSLLGLTAMVLSDAVILLLDDGRTKAALVTHDLISCSPGVVEGMRNAVVDGAGIPREHILVAASHGHSGPKWEDHPGWNRQVVKDVTAAVTAASQTYRLVSLGYGEDRIDFNINRRMMVEGRSVVRLNPDGPCDRRVKVLRVDDGQSLDPLAVVMHHRPVRPLLGGPLLPRE